MQKLQIFSPAAHSSLHSLVNIVIHKRLSQVSQHIPICNVIVPWKLPFNRKADIQKFSTADDNVYFPLPMVGSATVLLSQGINVRYSPAFYLKILKFLFLCDPFKLRAFVFGL